MHSAPSNNTTKNLRSSTETLVFGKRSVNSKIVEVDETEFEKNKKKFWEKLESVSENFSLDTEISFFKISIKNKILVQNFFQKRFFLVGIDSNKRTKEIFLLFLHAPSCVGISRFFSSPDGQREAVYSVKSFRQLDTLVPLYEGTEIVSGGLSVLKGVWAKNFLDVDLLHMVGVSLDKMGGRDGVLLAGSRPPIVIK